MSGRGGRLLALGRGASNPLPPGVYLFTHYLDASNLRVGRGLSWRGGNQNLAGKSKPFPTISHNGNQVRFL